MGLEEVVADILEKAKSEASAIIKQGKASSEEILKNADKEIAKKEDASKAELEAIKESAERKELSDATRSSKKQLQEIKRELLEDAESLFRKKIDSLSDKNRAQIIEKLGKKAMSEIEKASTIYVSKKDVRLAAGIFKGIPILEAPILGGVIVESEDRAVRADHSFDMIIAAVREKCVGGVSGIIFQ